MRLQLDDAVIDYDFTTTDGGQAPLLFLHGALGVRGQFDALRKRFAERSQLAMDFAAHGASDLSLPAMNSERLARDVLALLDHLQIDRVDIVGHSMGGYVGLVLAHLAPARVRSVIALGTKFYWSEQAVDATLGELDGAAIRARSPRYYDALTALHIAAGVEKNLALTHSLIVDFKRWQLSEQMVSASMVPVMLCTGDRDTFVPAAEVARLFDALATKQKAMAVLPHTPHPLQHVPVDCFEPAARRFWEKAVAA